MGGGLPQNFTRMMDGFSTCTRFRYSDSDYMQEKQGACKSLYVLYMISSGAVR